MGLDWIPIDRPKPGHEAEFRRLFAEMSKGPEEKAGLFAALRRKLSGMTPERLKERWHELGISPYETLNAPQVGRDPAADAWAYENRRDPAMGQAEVLAALQGFYVVALVPECDGLPPYSNGQPGGYVDLFSFRAQFLNDCEDLLEPALFERCYTSCLAPGLAELGRDLRQVANVFASQNNVAQVQEIRILDPWEEGTPEARAHILFAAAKWCEFWSSRGHGMSAYF